MGADLVFVPDRLPDLIFLFQDLLLSVGILQKMVFDI